MAVIDLRLRDRGYLLDAFSVADAYLTTVLLWSAVTPVDLRPYPAITAYLARMRARPSIARAASKEYELHQRAKARRAAPTRAGRRDQ